jgi:hypothetical protein
MIPKITVRSSGGILNWEDDGFTRKGTATIIIRARKACKKLGVGLKLEESLLVTKTGDSEKKTNAAIGVGRYRTQKVVRSQKLKIVLMKEKHGATFATLKTISYRTRCSQM